MITKWALRRRGAVISFFIFILAGAAGLYWYVTKEPPSCFDKKQNQGEEGVDCGDPCISCASQIRDVVVLWRRFFVLKDGFVDVAALIQNPNQLLRAKEFRYAVRVFDSANVLIAVRENTITVQPGEKMLIFEPQIPIIERTPARVIVEPRSASWEQGDAEVVKVNIVRLQPLLMDEFPRLEARVRNEASYPYERLEVSAILYRGDEAVGVSRTILNGLDLNEENNLIFTWPKIIEGVSRAELLFRTLR